MKNNIFYVSDKHCLLIFETKDNAELAVAHILNDGGRWRIGSILAPQAKVAAGLWTNHFGSKVHYSKLGEPIFLIGAEGIFWNVIIGEHIGWIVAESWTGVGLLNKNGK